MSVTSSLTANYSSPALGIPPLIQVLFAAAHPGAARPDVPAPRASAASLRFGEDPVVPSAQQDEHPATLGRGTTARMGIITGFGKGNQFPIMSRSWEGAQMALLGLNNLFPAVETSRPCLPLPQAATKYFGL